MHPRPAPHRKAATNRRLLSRIHKLHARVARAVAFMDREAGYGWRRRMEVRDHALDQDYPQVWLSGRKIVSAANLQRFENYCRRFGYVPPTDDEDLLPPKRDFTQLENALNKLASSNSVDALEKSPPSSDATSNFPVDPRTCAPQAQ